jgi:hypothetical protein
MIVALRVLFSIFFVTIVAATTWASLQESLLVALPKILEEPWWIATMVDTYLAFFCFYVWIFYRERGALSRMLWFLGVVFFGNIAMALYALIALFQVPASGDLSQVLLRPESK